jgi:hypothetical protein
MTGSSEESIKILMQAYRSSDRETKVNILAALGFFGKQEVLSFFNRSDGRAV